MNASPQQLHRDTGDNLAVWNKHADIDPKFTKPITGKAYKGTSPNPQHVIWCLTDLFGPVGKGFGWEVVAEGFQPLGDTFLHWCRVRFWWADTDGKHSVEQYGQTKAHYPTRNGVMTDEDAPKKSITDAIVKAASHLGIAANIFLGRWDDQKYVASVADTFEKDEREKARDPRKVADALIAAVRKRATAGELNQLKNSDKFTEPRDWLETAKPPMCAEVDAAVTSRLAELEAALQNRTYGPEDDLSDIAHTY